MPDAKSDLDQPMVVNCPVCFRIRWANTVCHHGTVPPPAPSSPAETAAADQARAANRPGGKSNTRGK